MKLHRSLLRRQRGIALVLTLAVLAVLSLIVIGFLVSMRTEQAAARNAVYMTVARQLAQAAVDNAVYRMRANMPLLDASNSFVTMAGAAACWPAAPAVGGNLFSVSSSGTIDLNADQAIVSASNSLYSTPPARQITANWIDVATDGSGSGALLGRFAFWVDDEASKLNINSANQRLSTDISGTSPSAVDLTVLSGIAAGKATASWNYGQTNGFFTAEQWQQAGSGANAITLSLYSQYQFYITPFGIDADQTPWGATKFHLNSDFATWQAEVDNGGTNTINNRALDNWFGAGNNFVGKYGGNTNLSRQILANMADFRFAAGGGMTPCMGAQAGYLDAGLPGTLGIPMFYLGLRRFPFLNEIAVLPTWQWTGGDRIQLNLWVIAELVNPYGLDWGAGGSVKINVDKLLFRVSSPAGPLIPYNLGVDGGWNTEIEVNIGDVPAYSYSVIVTNFTFIDPNPQPDTNAVVDVVEVRMNKIRLMQTSAFTDSVRDWAQWSDFDQYAANTGVAAPPLGSQPNHFIFVGTNRIAQGSTPPALTSAYLQGLAKNDPRVRTFTTWTPPLPAWYRVGDTDVTGVGPSIASGSNLTLNAQNSIVNLTSGTGLANVPNDPLPTGAGLATATNVATSPSFYMKMLNVNTNYDSSGELGYIHTGLQWRTLMLQPCPTNELNANLIPDWVVLDMFSVTNAPLQGRININGIVTNLASSTPGYPQRLAPLQGLLTAITAANNMGFATEQALIASNIYNQYWAPSSTWGANRTTLPRTFSTNVFNMIGELCEVDKVAANWSPATAFTNDAVRENRIRSFANLVTTRSDTFTVWGVGQATDTLSNVVAEAKVQAVVQRYEDRSTTPGTVKFRTLYFRYLTP